MKYFMVLLIIRNRNSEYVCIMCIPQYMCHKFKSKEGRNPYMLHLDQFPMDILL